MRKRTITFVAFTIITSLVGCNTQSDDGVGEKPRPSTESSIYFREGAAHTIHMVEKEERTVLIDGATDAFTFTETSGEGITVSKLTAPARLKIKAKSVGTYPILLAEGSKKATLNVVVNERDTGWKNGIFTIEDIDGDKTEEKSTGYVEIELPAGTYTYDSNSLLPENARDRVQVQVIGEKIRVTALNHYDENTPITFKVKNQKNQERTVVIKRVTKFWRTESNGYFLVALSNPIYVTKRSFDERRTPPKVPYTVKSVYNGASSSSVQQEFLWNNPKITKIDLNNMETIQTSSFMNSSNLETIIAGKVTTIEHDALKGTKIKKLVLPEITKIHGTLPSTLQYLTLGKKFTYMWDNTLRGTENSLMELRIEVTTPGQITYFPPYGDPNYKIIGENNTAKLLVPKQALEDYKIRFPWITTLFKGGVEGYE